MEGYRHFVSWIKARMIAGDVVSIGVFSQDDEKASMLSFAVRVAGSGASLRLKQVSALRHGARSAQSSDESTVPPGFCARRSKHSRNGLTARQGAHGGVFCSAMGANSARRPRPPYAQSSVPPASAASACTRCES